MPLPFPSPIPILLATSLLTACAGQTVPVAQLAPQQGAAHPPALRGEPATLAAMAQAQLKDGHFAAAADSFVQARTAGDDGPRTLLGLALALAGSWRHEEAARLLLTEGDALPAGDRGLALALAGEPAIAVRLLVLAVEEHPDDVALRQNLAFAFALAGRWQEARTLAARDVPPGELPARMEKWARLASAGPTPQRMAIMFDTAPPRMPQARPMLAWRRPHWAGARW